MNPVQNFSPTTMQGLFYGWAYTDILAKLIYARIVDLRLEFSKKQGTVDDLAVVIPETEMQYLVLNAVNGAQALSTAFFQVTEGGQAAASQHRRTA